MPRLQQAGDGICESEWIRNDYQTHLLGISVAAAELAGWTRRWEASNLSLSTLFSAIQSRLSAMATADGK